LKAFSDSFGMQDFPGKKAAVFSDVRIDVLTTKELSMVTERLLSITGEDEMHINRKHKGYYMGALPTRLAFLANELPKFEDETGALSSRMLIFRMKQQFLDERQDPNLTAKLLAERSGILNLALDALDALRSRGHLIQCASGLDMVERFADQVSYVRRFIDECCEIGPEYEAKVGTLFQRWQLWCQRCGIRFKWEDNTLSEKLQAAVPTIIRGRPRNAEGKPNPKRHVLLTGIRVRQE
jgi:putative DNA primase/helicase